jgi:hypothetical protein
MLYTSSARFLGLPLVEIMFGGSGGRRFARAWIAVGDVALGPLFAFGAFALAPVAVGGIAVGLLPIAGIAFGAFAVGGAAIGVWSVGGIAVAVHAALGGLAVAARFASGGVAIAVHANDGAANAFFAAGPFAIVRSWLPLARWLPVLTAIPVTAAVLRRRRTSP